MPPQIPEAWEEGMDRKTLASVIGLSSVVSSSTIWMELAVGRLIGHVPGWMNIGVDGWVAGWMLGFLLAAVATALWPRRWWPALFFPVISFAAALGLISFSHVEW